MVQEDVEVVLAQSNGEQGGGSEEVLVVNVQHISAQFKALKWSYKQNYFPNMKVGHRQPAAAHDEPLPSALQTEGPRTCHQPTHLLPAPVGVASQGDGVADANVVDGCIRLGFRVKRREVGPSHHAEEELGIHNPAGSQEA